MKFIKLTTARLENQGGRQLYVVGSLVYVNPEHIVSIYPAKERCMVRTLDKTDDEILVMHTADEVVQMIEGGNKTTVPVTEPSIDYKTATFTTIFNIYNYIWSEALRVFELDKQIEKDKYRDGGNGL